jgi:hypothetical protein
LFGREERLSSDCVAEFRAKRGGVVPLKVQLENPAVLGEKARFPRDEKRTLTIVANARFELELETPRKTGFLAEFHPELTFINTGLGGE